MPRLSARHLECRLLVPHLPPRDLSVGDIQAPLTQFIMEPARVRGMDYSRVVAPCPLPPTSLPSRESLHAATTEEAEEGSPSIVAAASAIDPAACVVFLGTSAAVPSKYRNGEPVQAAVLVRFNWGVIALGVVVEWNNVCVKKGGRHGGREGV